VRGIAKIARVALRIEESRRLAFHDDRTYWAAGCGVRLWAIAAIIAASAAELLIVVLVLPLVLLRLRLLLIAAPLRVSVTVPEAAKPSASLSAAIATAVVGAARSVGLTAATAR